MPNPYFQVTFEDGTKNATFFNTNPSPQPLDFHGFPPIATPESPQYSTKYISMEAAPVPYDRGNMPSSNNVNIDKDFSIYIPLLNSDTGTWSLFSPQFSLGATIGGSNFDIYAEPSVGEIDVVSTFDFIQVFPPGGIIGKQLLVTIDISTDIAAVYLDDILLGTLVAGLGFGLDAWNPSLGFMTFGGLEELRIYEDIQEPATITGLTHFHGAPPPAGFGIGPPFFRVNAENAHPIDRNPVADIYPPQSVESGVTFDTSSFIELLPDGASGVTTNYAPTFVNKYFPIGAVPLTWDPSNFPAPTIGGTDWSFFLPVFNAATFGSTIQAYQFVAGDASTPFGLTLGFVAGSPTVYSVDVNGTPIVTGSGYSLGDQFLVTYEQATSEVLVYRNLALEGSGIDPNPAKDIAQIRLFDIIDPSPLFEEFRIYDQIAPPTIIQDLEHWHGGLPPGSGGGPGPSGAPSGSLTSDIGAFMDAGLATDICGFIEGNFGIAFGWIGGYMGFAASVGSGLFGGQDESQVNAFLLNYEGNQFIDGYIGGLPSAESKIGAIVLAAPTESAIRGFIKTAGLSIDSQINGFLITSTDSAIGSYLLSEGSESFIEGYIAVPDGLGGSNQICGFVSRPPLSESQIGVILDAEGVDSSKIGSFLLSGEAFDGMIDSIVKATEGLDSEIGAILPANIIEAIRLGIIRGF